MKTQSEKKPPLAGKALVDEAVKQAIDKLAENIVVLDLNGLPGSADWFIICEGTSTVHNQAIFDGIVDGLTELQTRPWHQEGETDGRWVLIDYSDVVIHIMLPELREYYAIESLWSGAKKEKPGKPKSSK